MPHLTEAQSKGLALWTFGAITAQSGRQNSAIAALTFTGGFSAVRQRLYDGADRSTPSPNRMNVRACFAPLMRWVLSLWTSSDLALAIDPTMRVIVMADRGLRSPKLWKKIRFYGWRPYMRRRIDTVFCLDGGMRMPARRLVSGPGNSFIGIGTAFRAKSKRLRGTIIVI